MGLGENRADHAQRCSAAEFGKRIAAERDLRSWKSEITENGSFLRDEC